MLRFALAAFILAASPGLAQDYAPFASYVGASEPVLNDPHDLTFGPDGLLYIADKFGNRVAVMDPNSLELLYTFGDGEVAGAHDVSFGPDGILHVAATGRSVVISYDVTTDPPSRVGALGPFPRTEGALAHSNGRLYVMASGTGQLVAAEGENVLAIAGGMPGAHDVAEGPDGSVWVADNAQRRIVRYDQDLQLIQEIKGERYGFLGPRYIDFDQDGMLYVADQDAHRVLKIDPLTGDIFGVIGTGAPGMGPGLLDDPEGVAVRGSEYYFADSDNNRIVKYELVIN